MIFQHARFQIWNQNQHPFVHSLSDFGYAHASLPGVVDMETALNYIIAVLYPNAKAAVATPAALPAVGNTINDYRVVTDDGDGSAAGYRWYIKEGTGGAAWHKILDMDWGTDSVLQAWQNKTLELYVIRNGYDDIDETTGLALAGTYAGQQIFGGTTAGSNLTLSANSGDAAGPNTGYVQITDTLRPVINSSLSLGTTLFRFLKGWFDELQISTLNLVGGLITDSSGAISFSNENLSTTGTLTVGNFLVDGTTSKITSSSGTIDIDNEHLTTTGNLTANKVTATGAASTFFTGTTIADFTLSNGNIASASAAVSFNALDINTTGFFTAEKVTVNALQLDANSLSVVTLNTDLALAANGTGVISLASALTTSSNVTMTSAILGLATSTVNLTGTLNVDDMRLTGATLSTVTANADLNLSSNGTGHVVVAGEICPQSNSTYDVGTSALMWVNLWFTGDLKDGTNTFIHSELMALRSTNYRDAARTIPALSGDALFFDGTQWLASVPDSEITHSSLTGLTTGDAGHTQFALLAGRAGGQALIGGTATGENLDLESTGHATKGFVQLKDTLRPFVDAAYSAGWTGTDIGHSARRINNIVSVGEFLGLRLENLGAAPSSSSQKVGRLIYLTTDENVYIDTGTALKQVGGARYSTDTSWDGSTLVKNVTVSGTDARLAIWQLKDNTNDFEIIYCSIKATSATNILITVGSALPAGSYRLVGV